MNKTETIWYGIYNADTEEFYPMYGSNRTMLETVAASMNRKIKNRPHVYTTKEIDIDAVWDVHSK